MNNGATVESDHCSSSFSKMKLSLAEATSVARFESTTIDAFTKSVCQSLRQSLVAEGKDSVKSNPFRVSYNVEKIQNVLTDETDWMTLLAHYDKTIATRNSDRTQPLDIILHALMQDPATVPRACHPIVLVVVWNQIIRYSEPSVRRPVAWYDEEDFLTRAQRTAWNAVLRQAQQYPTTWKEILASRLICDGRVYSFKECDVLFRMMHEILQQTNHGWPNHLLRLMAFRLLRCSELYLESKTNDALSNINSHRRKGNRLNPFEASHLSEECIGEERMCRVVPNKSYAIKALSYLSLSRMLKQSGTMTGMVRQNEFLVSSDPWDSWRKSVFSFAMDFISRSQEHSRYAVDQIWSVILERPNESALLRFLLVSTMASDAKFQQEWALYLLQFAQISGQNLANFALRCYSEMVVELAAFDNSKSLEIVTAPLFKCFLDNEDASKVPSAWKRALVYVLSRRSSWLDHIPNYAAIKAKISFFWSSVDDWIDSSMSSDEQFCAIAVLRQAGILGICETIDHHTDSTKESGSLQHEEWPFTNENGLRASCSRYKMQDASQDLFSECIPGAMERRKSDPKEMGDFVKNFVHGDILLRVFSFLGFRRMASVQIVCRDWRDTANHPKLWRSFYEYRYGVLPEDPISDAPDYKQEWKTLFHHRLIVERELRGRTWTKKSKRPKVCKYVGCHKIVTTVSQLKQHYARHQNTCHKEASRKKARPEGQPRGKSPKRKRKQVS